jgi:hypothetical protein
VGELISADMAVSVSPFFLVVRNVDVGPQARLHFPPGFVALEAESPLAGAFWVEPSGKQVASLAVEVFLLRVQKHAIGRQGIVTYCLRTKFSARLFR